MGKYSAVNKLSKAEQQELFIDFAKAFASGNNPVEAANFIKDLFSEVEVIMLARRLQVARLLVEGWTYEKISQVLKVSNSTIARIHTWLNLYGEGYRIVLKRTKPEKRNTDAQYDPASWKNIKRKYPIYFWPELVLEEIVKNANAKQRRKLEAVLAK